MSSGRHDKNGTTHGRAIRVFTTDFDMGFSFTTSDACPAHTLAKVRTTCLVDTRGAHDAIAFNVADRAFGDRGQVCEIADTSK